MLSWLTRHFSFLDDGPESDKEYFETHADSFSKRNRGKNYSIQINTTQDAGVVDQAYILLRYGKDEEIPKWLPAVVPV